MFYIVFTDSNFAPKGYNELQSSSAALFPLGFTEQEQPNIKIMLDTGFADPSPGSSSNKFYYFSRSKGKNAARCDSGSNNNKKGHVLR